MMINIFHCSLTLEIVTFRTSKSNDFLRRYRTAKHRCEPEREYKRQFPVMQAPSLDVSPQQLPCESGLLPEVNDAVLFQKR